MEERGGPMDAPLSERQGNEGRLCLYGCSQPLVSRQLESAF